MRCAIFSSRDFTSRAQARYKSTRACISSTNVGPSGASGSLPGGILSERSGFSSGSLSALFVLPVVFFLVRFTSPSRGKTTSAHSSRSIPAAAEFAAAALGNSRVSSDAALPLPCAASGSCAAPEGEIVLWPFARPVVRSWPLGFMWKSFCAPAGVAMVSELEGHGLPCPSGPRASPTPEALRSGRCRRSLRQT